jgi:Flp pilus assembly protein TadB
MTWNRTIAILVGIVASLVCGNLVGINWYVSFAIGIAGYFVTRYVLWAIADQRRLKGELDQFIKDYRDKTPTPP